MAEADNAATAMPSSPLSSPPPSSDAWQAKKGSKVDLGKVGDNWATTTSQGESLGTQQPPTLTTRLQTSSAPPGSPITHAPSTRRPRKVRTPPPAHRVRAVSPSHTAYRAHSAATECKTTPLATPSLYTPAVPPGGSNGAQDTPDPLDTHAGRSETTSNRGGSGEASAQVSPGETRSQVVIPAHSEMAGSRIEQVSLAANPPSSLSIPSHPSLPSHPPAERPVHKRTQRFDHSSHTTATTNLATPGRVRRDQGHRLSPSQITSPAPPIARQAHLAGGSLKSMRSTQGRARPGRVSEQRRTHCHAGSSRTFRVPPKDLLCLNRL